MPRLAGRWAGTYTYAEPKPEGPQEVGFTLEIFDGSSWRLRGHVSDDPAVGVGGQGTITGWSWGRYIWFRKVMPIWGVAQDPKPITLADYLHKEFGERPVHDAGPHVISYRGVVAGDQRRVSGTWTTQHHRLVLASGRVVVFPAARGTWEMQRQ